MQKVTLEGGYLPKSDIRRVKHLYGRRNDGIRNAERFAIASNYERIMRAADAAAANDDLETTFSDNNENAIDNTPKYPQVQKCGKRSCNHYVIYNNHFIQTEWDNYHERLRESRPGLVCPACGETTHLKRGKDEGESLRDHMFHKCKKYPFGNKK